ncbi:CRISPR-associated endonuclease Cas1 [Roseiflexus castenholzii]|uniref:CRISPR-associated endonuclease Cas1 n=1 Tax=Roseiflexus castenholzii TaxID=120962 RepID=UPI0018DD3A77|nr:CRISPR-associated endonuclease Cas1 [Roseiflexus castenholzii]
MIVKSRGVSISTDAILACAEGGTALPIVSGGGARSGAALYTTRLTGFVLIHRAQLQAYTDQRALTLAATIVLSKNR